MFVGTLVLHQNTLRKFDLASYATCQSSSVSLDSLVSAKGEIGNLQCKEVQRVQTLSVTLPQSYYAYVYNDKAINFLSSSHIISAHNQRVMCLCCTEAPGRK